ncbi:MAG TPA: hypothetical protein GYA05_05390 [Acholeplasmataceae bacterium]|nr:hypothetical protein [Acholeplasmataceae bacterium]
MDRNKYNAKFFNKDKMLNPEEQDNTADKFAPPLTDAAKSDVEFAKESCQEEFERLRRERNKEKNLK